MNRRRINRLQRSEQASARERKDIWWLHPIVYLVVLAILVVLAFIQSGRSYAIEFGSQKWIGIRYVALSGVAILLTAAGLYFGLNERPKDLGHKLNKNRLESAYFVITAVCFVAYFIWFANFARLQGFSAFLSVFSPSSMAENMYTYRNDRGSITGITSFTEFGVVTCILGALILNSREAKHRTAVRFTLVILFLLAYVRAALFSERLALIELALPFAVAWFGSSPKPASRLDRWLPVVAVVLLVFVFGVFEYQRSWLNYYVYYYDNFWDFSITRLFGYYTNAANTEAMYIEKGPTSWLPYWSIQWLWQMPLFKDFYAEIADPNVSAVFNELLGRYANREFNNPGGVLTFFKDFSYFGFLLNFFFGLFVGHYYSWFKAGVLEGQLLYPIFILTLSEMPRYFYLGNNRSFLVVVALFLIPLIVGRQVKTSA